MIESAQDAYLQLAHLGPVYLFAISAAVFVPLAVCFAGVRSQPVLRRGMLPDVIYWLAVPWLAITPLTLWLFGLLLDAGLYSVDSLGNVSDGRFAVQWLPAVAQALLILLLMDLAQYWVHRLLHTEALWRFHAIHHSAVHVDWLTSARFHPIDTVLRTTCVYLLVVALGFSTEAWLLLVPFNALFSPLVHANLNWTYGPFRCLLVSPVFHRWHHTHAAEGGLRNFAPTFPFIDVLFGTYYAPEGVHPTVFGAPNDAVSDTDIVRQLLYPLVPNLIGESQAQRIAEPAHVR